MAHIQTHSQAGHTLSPEQIAILEFITGSPTQSLIVDSCAGASKTTTLVEVCHAIAANNLGTTIAMAFNKSIAIELDARTPDSVATGTINSIGHRAIGSFTRKSLKVQDTKPWGIWRSHSPYFQSLDKDIQSEIIEAYAAIKKIGAAFASSPLGPNLPCSSLSDLSPEYIFQFALHEAGLIDLDFAELGSVLQSVWNEDISQSLREGIIQFADQVYLPAIYSQIALPIYTNVIVDEAQDLSPLDHALLLRMVSKYPAGRLIAFGDKGQAIYGFRGADYNSFASLENLFQAHTLALPVSYRCPRAVVAEAAKIDSRIQAWSESPEGSVSRQPYAGISDLPSGSAILCRTNAPLIRVAIQAIQDLRPCNFLGRDLEKQLLNFLSIHAKGTNSLSGLWHALQVAASNVDTKGAKTRIRDFTDCLKAIAAWQHAESAEEVASGIQRLFQQSGTINLATVHKAKGLEWPHVYLIRPDLIPSPMATTPEEIQQEYNIWYVAITRAQSSFTYLEGEI